MRSPVHHTVVPARGWGGLPYYPKMAQVIARLNTPHHKRLMEQGSGAGSKVPRPTHAM